ncbi:uncharacterized protein LOC131228951 [Magnolia sinica]|uniref:uncharacterized protein LOC131228951 n=1 Tax=Magnolia sinica TaxID=86752 RepID=UPI00265B704E|nr:uncharacterized protein LOC131228951 [Magnolia sinica]
MGEVCYIVSRLWNVSCWWSLQANYHTRDMTQLRCNISSIMLEMDQMLRPGGCTYIHVFSGFSLHVPSGMIVALVGESGSGKLTVISLLERFLTPKLVKCS